MNDNFKIMVTGDYACYTRPEMKAERVSYDVPTPSAIEGMLKSIYWKPAIRYVVDRIVVFNPIEFMNIRRNEVKNKLSFVAIKKRMADHKTDVCLYTAEDRNQRAAMVLRNVKYGIEFHIELTGICNEREESECDTFEKHNAILRRRLENGQWFKPPFLGCDEFPVRSMAMVDEFPMNEISDEIINLGDVDFGFMLYELDYLDHDRPVKVINGRKVYSEKANAMYYRPHMEYGVINVGKYVRDLKC